MGVDRETDGKKFLSGERGGTIVKVEGKKTRSERRGEMAGEKREREKRNRKKKKKKWRQQGEQKRRG